jgi:hypothetical protein
LKNGRIHQFNVLFKNYCTGMGIDDVDWIHKAQDRDQWRTLVMMVINLEVQQKAGVS